MADDELKQPLLETEENTSFFSDPRQKIKKLYESDKVLGRHSPYTGRGDGTINISASTSIQNLQSETRDHIVAIFVVAFDTKHGEFGDSCLTGDDKIQDCESKLDTWNNTYLKDHWVNYNTSDHTITNMALIKSFVDKMNS